MHGLLLQVPPNDGVAPEVVRDTVRAIVDGIAYRRAAHSSLFQRAWLWVGEQLDRLAGMVREVPHGRTLALIGVGLIVLLIVGRVVWASRLGVDELEGASRGGGRQRAPTLADADRLAATGAYMEATHALYRAVLELLVRRDGVRLHRSKTSGDYVRDLRRRGSPATQAFRQFARRHDRIVFGVASCDAQAWAELRTDAEPVLRAERAA